MGSVYRKQSRGNDLGWYLAYVDVDGKRRHIASHQPTKKEAAVLLAEIEGRVRRGMVGVPEPAPSARITFAEIVERYLSEFNSPTVKDLSRRLEDCRSILRRLLPHLGKFVAAELTAARLAKVRDLLARELAPNTVRLTLATFKAVMSWARREGLVTTETAKVQMPRPVVAVEYLDADEVARLLAEVKRRNGSLRDGSRQVAVMLALLAGLRRGEIFGLRWTDVDVTTGRLTIARSYATTPKNGQTRHLRLPPDLRPVLVEWQRRCPRTTENVVCPVQRHGCWKMGTEAGDFGLKELLAAARCKPLRRGWHALRHTFASHFVMQGGSVLTLAKILGHAGLRMTMIYAHLAPDFLGNEMERVKFAGAGAAQEPAPSVDKLDREAGE